MSWRIICDSAELAVECLQTAQGLELDARPALSNNWFRDAADELVAGAHIGMCIADKVELAQLIELARAQPRGRPQISSP